MGTTRLKRTPSSTGTRTKFTYSAWVKRSSNGYHPLMSSWSANTDAGYISLRFGTNGKLDCTGWTTQWFETTQVFRDVNAWYHIVLSVDSTLATAGDRMKLYVNGTEVSNWDTKNNPSQNQEFPLSHSGTPHFIGVQFYAGSTYSHYYDGSMSHIHFIDGTAYPASTFGSTDATTGEWKINTSPNVTYGTNGFFILKNGNSVTDQSGQSNNLTVDNGTLSKTEDNPSNVFATLNSLSTDRTSGITLSNGNNTLTTPSGGHDFAITTLGMNSGSGKFYCEVKVSSSSNFNMIGISDHSYQGSNQELSEDNYSYGYYSDSGGGSTAGVVRGNGSNVLTGMPNFTTNDIIGIAIDLENHKLYFHKNGTYINSGDPTSGSTGTGAVSIQDLRTVTSSYGNAAYFFGVSDWTTSSGGTYQCNFGNGYFGTTAVSSAGTNASNNGIFEYDVPAGYTALSTKGLNL